MNIVGGIYGSALASASVFGRNEIVRTLLENGADVDMVGGDYGSALALASAFGQKEVVQILLENGADVNSLGEGNWSPLRFMCIFIGIYLLLSVRFTAS